MTKTTQLEKTNTPPALRDHSPLFSSEGSNPPLLNLASPDSPAGNNPYPSLSLFPSLLLISLHQINTTPN